METLRVWYDDGRREPIGVYIAPRIAYTIEPQGVLRIMGQAPNKTLDTLAVYHADGWSRFEVSAE